ncbi:amino acid ABC transporter permease [Methanoculleus sp.]|jgi:polar amino acid transport system permease protein|uniref:amino acid ABC transporter permease n=1 Tax=Methanoculleus sp. TaxID=90427 RepID=UPI00260BB9C3|nr:amino acid ABC transporter permease [Methanoculleus sp.]MDI6867300.1 amino acid ABC transporter permease [Methanoculleus sp.]
MDVLPILIDWSPYILRGVASTLGLVLIALALGVLLGLPMALGQVYGSRPVRWIIGVYVWFFRGLPILVLLFLFWFGIFPATGLGHLSAFVVGAVVLGLRGAAYQSQIFRGSIQSVGEGQMIAARSLGMSRFAAIRSVILPQALRIALPAWSNEYPNILTDSAVCYAIGVVELLTITSRIVVQTHITMPIYLTAAAIFIVLNYGGLKLLHALEERVAIPGFGAGAV